MEIRKYNESDVPAMVRIWNEVVEEGVAFPQEEFLDERSGRAFFAAQSYCGVAVADGRVVGLYILHPNNIGRCGHIANASYAVDSACRGERIGEKLVSDVLRRPRSSISGSCSSTPLWRTIFTPVTCMNGLASLCSEPSPAASG